MHRAARDDDLIAFANVRIGQVDRQEGVVLLDRRTEEERIAATQTQYQARYKVRSLME